MKGLHIFNPSFPIPVKLNSRYRYVGMNWWWGTYKIWYRNIDHPENNSGPPPVQNIGANDGYEGVLTVGLGDCFGFAVVEWEISSEKITRISMAHLLSGLDLDQIQVLKPHLLNHFNCDSTSHIRYIIIFPGSMGKGFFSYCPPITDQTLDDISTIMDISKDQIIVYNESLSKLGSPTACITFDGFIGHIDHLGIEFDRHLLEADVEITDTEPTSRYPQSEKLIRASLTKDKYEAVFSTYPLMRELLSGKCIYATSSENYYFIHREAAQRFIEKQSINHSESSQNELPLEQDGTKEKLTFIHESTKDQKILAENPPKAAAVKKNANQQKI